MRNIILHSHIFKNAGTTFDYSLKRNFSDEFIDHRDDQKIVQGKLNFLKEYLKSNEGIKAFSSHSVHFKALNDDQFRFHQVYFLRHPIERIKSVYAFERQQPKEVSIGAKKAKEFDFDKYIEWRMENNVAATIRNCHTIFLSGKGPEANEIDYKFNVAASNIEKIPLIGVVDRYDESMVIFEEYLKDYFEDIHLSYVRQNITETHLEQSISFKADQLLNSLNNELRQLVLDKNNLDMKLYELANSKLDQQISTIDNFEGKLDLFKKGLTLNN